MAERRYGIVKWYKEDQGYGRIMLDGQEDNLFLYTSAKYYQTLLGYRTAFGSLKRVKKLHSTYSSFRI
ncbi:cold shock domain-containing protein [Paenibacillus sp. FSL K6-3166]|uniref:cold shock domain-containing protein n=1 Tax=unclassified Paenibacillus TaxID=185978 RepID=UPI001C533056|nr:cold shock domain-containing protein [Paenibacillus sp. VTT E-133291]